MTSKRSSECDANMKRSAGLFNFLLILTLFFFLHLFLVQNLYLELYVLKKFEQEYVKKCGEEQNNILSQKGKFYV